MTKGSYNLSIYLTSNVLCGGHVVLLAHTLRCFKLHFTPQSCISMLYFSNLSVAFYIDFCFILVSLFQFIGSFLFLIPSSNMSFQLCVFYQFTYKFFYKFTMLCPLIYASYTLLKMLTASRKEPWVACP